MNIDDIFGTCDEPKFIETFHSDLNSKFGVECKHRGRIQHALGISVNIDYEAQTAVLSQSKFIQDLLVKHNMEGCNARTLPLPTTFDIETAFVGDKLNKSEKQLYQSLVGSFLWLN